MAGREDAGPPLQRSGAAGAELSFPDQPRLELDQLLGQLVERAQEVLGTQGRLRDLLRANQAVSSELSSAGVLERTADVARDLIGARTASVEPAPPSARGPDRPGPPAAGTTARGSELHVPVQVRDELVGELHLVDSTRGGFTAEDLELAQALAVTAGLAVANARLYESARRRGEWLKASGAITRELLAGELAGTGALELVARSSRDVAGADVVAVLRPHQAGRGPRQLCVEVLVAAEGVAPVGRSVPREGTLLGRVLDAAEPISVADGVLDDEDGAMPWSEPEVGALLAVPLRGSGAVLGVLCAARLPGRPTFTDTDVEMAAGFANQAALAIELAEARAEQQRAVVLDERERIAADLHHVVVQRLFSVGLGLQGVLAGLTDRRTAGRVLATVEEVDRTIEHIRRTVFPLATARAPADPRERVLDAVVEAGAVLGFEPDVRFSGTRTGLLVEELAEDVAAVVRAALLDVARRGRATTAAVDVVEDSDGLLVHVRDDDPQGPDEFWPVGEELRHRAERHGGSCTVSPTSPVGASQYWWVPRR
ncbi:two-component system sensor histidine kinase [Modestobacter marinus]|uniref:GAF domain-containing protein n=1 Tax=Modestobacter marinus TaxID=477641 RepID=A0A846LU64_9ACTN|nr:GAF domain-containing protein [Modestobacter marinus]NIH69185.1 GAF domain-containing protein [Modestobacter marinus]GGL76839.1 histidine kinase [Modestobacter marinus]